jgi:hypothetical protein
MARVFISHSSRDNAAAERLKTWLGQQGFETPFLDFDKHAGIPVGANWEQTLYRKIEQCEAVIIVHTANWMDSKWCFAEFTQARALGKPIFPVIETPTGETFIAQDIQSLNLQSDRDGGLAQLANELTEIALDSQGGFAWNKNRPPYPGLLAFEEEDAPVYFGRDDEIRRLIERLNARRAQGGAQILALLGASGSGKSSLLRAGVVPRLKRDPRNWIVLPPMRPQPEPLDALAVSLAVAHDPGGDWRLLRDRLNGPEAVRHLRDKLADIRVARAANNARILLPVDQGEELFTVVEPAAADRFLDLLSAAARDELPLITVLAMRSDFLGRLQQASHLTARFEEFSLGPLPRSRYRQIIEGPARIAGIKVDDELVARATADAETDDALPLLAFALRELHDRHGGDSRLTIEEYLSLGDPRAGLTPLENAVRRAADATVADANPESAELAALRRAFVQSLVMVNQDGEYARRSARWANIPGQAQRLLERFADARLLVLREEDGERLVEVAHEALLRKWPQLTAWLDEAREFLIGRQQLERDLHDWQTVASDRQTAALLGGLKLERARSWLLVRGDQLTAEQRQFIEQSSAHAEREAGRRRAVRTWTMRATVLALAIVSGLAYLANDQRLVAEQAQRDADNQRLAAEQAQRDADNQRLAAEQAQRDAEAAARAQLDEAMHPKFPAAIVKALDKISGGGADIGTVWPEIDGWHTLIDSEYGPVIITGEMGKGRVLAVGHDALLQRADTTAPLLENAFAWLDGREGGRVGLTTSHGEWLRDEDANELENQLQGWGFDVQRLDRLVDAANLASLDVLVIGNAWCPLEAEELQAIADFVDDGGGLALAGLGWSWRQYLTDGRFDCPAERQAAAFAPDVMANYPMNQIGALFGIEFGTEEPM